MSYPGAPRFRTLELPPSTPQAPRMALVDLPSSSYPTPTTSTRSLEPTRRPASLGLHAYLARPQSSPLLLHSMLHPSTTALITHGQYHTATPQPIKGDLLGAPATSPPTHILRLIIPNLPCWSTLDLALPAGVPLTMAHVLNGLFEHLRTRVDDREASLVVRDRRMDVRAVGVAAQTRRRATGETHYAGLRRVDFLCGMTRWVGLERADHGGPETFVLVLAPASS